MKRITSKSGKTITFRLPTIKDVDGLLTYINSLITEDSLIMLNKKLTREQELKFVRNSLKCIKNKKRVQLLALFNNKIIGVSHIDKGEYRQSHVGDFGISVHKDYRNDGIGIKLARYTIAQAVKKLNIKLVKLDVFSQNKPAISLYRKLGFISYGQLPKGIKYKNKYIDKTSMFLHL